MLRHILLNPIALRLIVSILTNKRMPHWPAIVARLKTSAKDAIHDQDTPLADSRNRGQQEPASRLAMAAWRKDAARRLSAHSDARRTPAKSHRCPLKPGIELWEPILLQRGMIRRKARSFRI